MGLAFLWRHNGRDGVPYHQPHDCLINQSFRRRSDQRKHQSSASLAFVQGIHRWPVNSPHEWPVTRKMFPFDYAIMLWCRPQVNEQISPLNPIDVDFVSTAAKNSKTWSTIHVAYCELFRTCPHKIVHAWCIRTRIRVTSHAGALFHRPLLGIHRYPVVPLLKEPIMPKEKQTCIHTWWRCLQSMGKHLLW